MKLIKRMLYIFGSYFMFAIFSFVLITTTFPGVLKGGIFQFIFALITGLITIGGIYSYCWENGKKDNMFIVCEQKRNEDFTEKINYANGLFSVLPLVIINVALCIAAFWFEDIYMVIFRVFNSSFLGFMIDGDNKLKLIPSVIVVILPLVLCTLGYIAGIKKFNITERYLQWLVYKKPNKK